MILSSRINIPVSEVFIRNKVWVIYLIMMPIHNPLPKSTPVNPGLWSNSKKAFNCNLLRVIKLMTLTCHLARILLWYIQLWYNSGQWVCPSVRSRTVDGIKWCHEVVLGHLHEQCATRSGSHTNVQPRGVYSPRGAQFFEGMGWSGSELVAPTHLARRSIQSFPGRQPY